MAFDHDDAFFTRLIAPMLGQLRRLAAATRGEQTVDDLKTEAWLAARDIQTERGAEFQPEDEGFQQAIVAKLRKAFGRFANRKMRFAHQLDHEARGDDGDFLPNSIGSRLSAPEAYEPQIAIEAIERHAEYTERLASRFTEAIAYLRVLAHYDDDKREIADYLAISIGGLDGRLARAETFAELQASLFDGIENVPADFLPPRAQKRSARGRLLMTWKRVCFLMRPRQESLFSAIPFAFCRRP